MRANTLSPARIARTVSAILLLSLLQVVVAPVLAPSTFSAPANATIFDANNFRLTGNALNCGTTTCAAVPTTYNALTGSWKINFVQPLALMTAVSRITVESAPFVA